MIPYIGTSNDSKIFYLNHNSKIIGDLYYSSLQHAEVHLSSGQLFTFSNTEEWNSAIELKENERTLLTTQLGWNGIDMEIIGSQKRYLLKMRKYFNGPYFLLDESGHELFTVDIVFKWSKKDFKYTFNPAPYFDNLHNKELILFSAMHGINYYLSILYSGN